MDIIYPPPRSQWARSWILLRQRGVVWKVSPSQWPIIRQGALQRHRSHCRIAPENQSRGAGPCARSAKLGFNGKIAPVGFSRGSGMADARDNARPGRIRKPRREHEDSTSGSRAPSSCPDVFPISISSRKITCCRALRRRLGRSHQSSRRLAARGAQWII